MPAEASADLPEDSGRVLVPAAAGEDSAFDPTDSEKALRVVREHLAQVALEQQPPPPRLGQLACIDEGIQEVVVGRGDQLRVLPGIQEREGSPQDLRRLERLPGDSQGLGSISEE